LTARSDDDRGIIGFLLSGTSSADRSPPYRHAGRAVSLCAAFAATMKDARFRKDGNRQGRFGDPGDA
jgi:hypothetical protein